MKPLALAMAASAAAHLLALGLLLFREGRPAPVGARSYPLSVQLLESSGQPSPRKEGPPARPREKAKAEHSISPGGGPPSPNGVSTPAPSAPLAPSSSPLTPSGVEGAGAPGRIEEPGSMGGQRPGVMVDLIALHLRLARAAERCYPSAARRFRLTGEVQLSFCLDGSGAVSKLELKGSTGSPLLDRAARECVLPGAFPLGIQGGCYSVPVRFASTAR